MSVQTDAIHGEVLLGKMPGLLEPQVKYHGYDSELLAKALLTIVAVALVVAGAINLVRWVW